MGLFSGIKKAVGGVFNSAKSVLSSGLGGAVLEGAGSMLGYPGLGSAVSGLFGGTGSLSDVIGAGFKGYQQNLEGKTAKEQYENTLQHQIDAIRMQNASAKDVAQQANKFAVQNMKRQYQLGIKASGTAHQREISDLRKAGLNPILSGTGGMGASTPSVSAAPVAVAPVQGEQGAYSSAADIVRSMAEALKASAQTNLISGAQTELTKAQTTGTYAAAQTAGSQRDLNISAEALNRARVALTESQERNVQEEWENIKAIRDNLGKTGRLTDAQRRQVDQTVRNLEQTFKTLKMHGDIDASEYGKIMEIAKRATDVAGIDDLLKLFKGLKGLKVK